MVILFGIPQQVEIGGTLVVLNILGQQEETYIHEWQILQRNVPITRENGLNSDVVLGGS